LQGVGSDIHLGAGATLAVTVTTGAATFVAITYEEE